MRLTLDLDMLPIAVVAAVFILPKLVEILGRLWVALRRKEDANV